MLNIPWTIGVMTPNHRRWSEFYNRLSKLTLESGCRHDYSNAVKVLAEMGADVGESLESLESFTSHGGFCDCEILMNLGDAQ